MKRARPRGALFNQMSVGPSGSQLTCAPGGIGGPQVGQPQPPVFQLSVNRPAPPSASGCVVTRIG